MRRRGPVAALLALVLLGASFVAMAQKGEAEAEAPFDFEAAGGAAAAGPMHRAAVLRVSDYCTAQIPDSTAAWREATAVWDERNAPWMAASERVLEVAMRKLREQNEDADAVRGMLDNVIDEYAGRIEEEVRKQGETASVCLRMRAGVADGQFDVSTNGYTKAIDLLRTYLPANQKD